jgi:gliding motility-associated lipoprotein GldH
MYTSCTEVDVFEKNITIPNHSWSSQFKPEITFTIDDTLSRYKIFIVLRHSDAYRFKNIWINIHTESPSGVQRNQPLDMQLATDSEGWIAAGMDDLFEHRIMITPPGSPERLRAGTYKFKLENIMREDPLNHVWNVGIRLEKVQ